MPEPGSEQDEKDIQHQLDAVLTVLGLAARWGTSIAEGRVNQGYGWDRRQALQQTQKRCFLPSIANRKGLRDFNVMFVPLWWMKYPAPAVPFLSWAELEP